MNRSSIPVEIKVTALMTNVCLGNVFIVAAPSGGGKTSLVKKLIKSLDNIEVSVSHTTRQARPREKHGIDYFFVNDADFLKMVNQNEFVEYAQVFDHYYGTSLFQMNQRLQSGIDVVLDIDWQGAQQIKQIFPHAVSVFIIPPSLKVLKERLFSRGQDDESIIEYRMQRAQEEMGHYDEFDYLIVNDHFDRALSDLRAIVMADRLSIERQSKQVQKTLAVLLAS